MASPGISKDREIYSVCYQSYGKVLSQSQNTSCSWACPTISTVQTDAMTSPTSPSIHSDPQARDLAGVLKRILKSPTQVFSSPSDQLSFLSDSTDPNCPLRCYTGDFSSLADAQKRMEAYVQELVSPLQAAGSTAMFDNEECQKATKLTADAALAKMTSGIGWSHTQIASTRAEEADGSIDIGPVISEQYLNRVLSSEVSLHHASDGIEDLVSCDSGRFSNFESLDADSSSHGCVDIETGNAFSEGTIVDSASQLLNEEAFRTIVFNQNCVIGGIRDEPSSMFSSDSTLTPDSTPQVDLHSEAKEMEELQKRAKSRCNAPPSAIASEIQARVVSHGVATLQGTVMHQSCQSANLQPVLNQNLGVLQGFRGMPQAAETQVNFSSPIDTSTDVFTAPPAQGPLSAAALPGAQGDAATNSRASMRELAYRAAAFQPINWSKIEGITRPKRRNVRISKDPQSIAARRRREKISDRIRILQRLVPGGTRMDTASMLDEAINYLKFLKMQVQTLHRLEILSNGMYSNRNVFNTNSNNNNNFNIPLELASEVSSFRQPNPHRIPLPTIGQPEFPSFFSSDQNLYQQPCH